MGCRQQHCCYTDQISIVGLTRAPYYETLVARGSSIQPLFLRRKRDLATRFPHIFNYRWFGHQRPCIR